MVVSLSQLEWDEHCAEILEAVEDFFETQETDYDPEVKWHGGWRIGRTSRHRERLRKKARDALPGWVTARAERHYGRIDA
jgi:hypothetical protein